MDVPTMFAKWFLLVHTTYNVGPTLVCCTLIWLITKATAISEK